MANRGVAYIISGAGFADVNSVQFYFNYYGFQSPDEVATTLVGTFSPGLLPAATFKDSMKEAIMNWYSNNPSANYDDWNVLLDDFYVLNGIL